MSVEKLEQPSIKLYYAYYNPYHVAAFSLKVDRDKLQYLGFATGTDDADALETASWMYGIPIEDTYISHTTRHRNDDGTYHFFGQDFNAHALLLIEIYVKRHRLQIELDERREQEWYVNVDKVQLA